MRGEMTHLRNVIFIFFFLVKKQACVRILYKQFWNLPRGKGGSKRNNNVPVSESLLTWLFKRKALNYCCFLSHCRHYRKRGGSRQKRKKAVRGFVAVFHTHALGCH